MSEQELLESLRQGDPDAFAVLFETHSDKLYRVAVGILNNEDEAECVVQDTFVRLFEKLDQFEGRSTLGTWLYRVAYNASLDRLRKRRPTQPIADELGDDEDAPPHPTIFVDWSNAPEELLTSSEVQAQLRAAIAGLPESLGSVFVMREIEGLSTVETADILGISESAVKVRLHRARLALRETLSGYFAERLSV